MDSESASTSESNIAPVVYRKEYLEHKAAEKQRADDAKATEAAARAPKDYPIDALGPTLATVTMAIARRVQCAPSMVATSVLATVSLAAQAVADVALPDGQVVPLSLFAVVIAASGDRKTGVDKFVKKPIELREADLRKAYAEGISAYKRKKSVWDCARKTILIGKAPVDVKEEMLKKLGDEPVAPRQPQLTTADGTQEGIIEAYKTLPPAIGLFTGEGGQFFCGYGFSPEKKGATGAAFSTFWDADRLRKTRVGTGVTDLGGRRLAMNIMVQPAIAREMVTDSTLVDQGFIARLLLVEPQSLQGFRVYGNRDKSPGFNLAMGGYNLHMSNLFAAAKTKDDAGAELVVRVLQLSDAAIDAYDAYGNEVERGLRPDGRYARIRATAAKSAEQAARIAGLLTLLERTGAERSRTTPCSAASSWRASTWRKRFACSTPRRRLKLLSDRNCSSGS